MKSIIMLLLLGALVFGCKHPTNKPAQSINENAKPERLVSFHAPERRESVNLIIDGQGQLEERTVIAWRAQDRKVGSSKSYDSTGRLKWTENYIYDEHDKMVRIERHDPEGAIIIQTHFEFDQSGKHIGSKVVDADGNPVPPSEWEKYR